MKKSTRAQSLCPITPSPWQTSHPHLTLTRFSMHQKATLPKTKGTLTNGTLLLLKSLAAFCMLGNVDTLQTPRRGPAAVAASAPVVLLAAEASSSSHMIAPMNTKCFNVAGFQQIDLYPTRSPLAVADFLAWRLAGKEVVEIGSRNGDILSCLQGLGVKRVESIEGDHVYCKKLRARGLAVSCKMLTQANAKDTLPRADAYFGWLPGGNFDGGGGVGHVMHLLMKELSTRPAKASIFLMFDASQSIEMTTLKQMLPRIAPQCNGGLNMSRIFFDESNYPIPSGESFNHEAKDRGVAVQETNCASFLCPARPTSDPPEAAQKINSNTTPRFFLTSPSAQQPHPQPYSPGPSLSRSRNLNLPSSVAHRYEAVLWTLRPIRHHARASVRCRGR